MGEVAQEEGQYNYEELFGNWGPEFRKAFGDSPEEFDDLGGIKQAADVMHHIIMETLKSEEDADRVAQILTVQLDLETNREDAGELSMLVLATAQAGHLARYEMVWQEFLEVIDTVEPDTKKAWLLGRGLLAAEAAGDIGRCEDIVLEMLELVPAEKVNNVGGEGRRDSYYKWAWGYLMTYMARNDRDFYYDHYNCLNWGLRGEEVGASDYIWELVMRAQAVAAIEGEDVGEDEDVNVGGISDERYRGIDDNRKYFLRGLADLMGVNGVMKNGGSMGAPGNLVEILRDNLKGENDFLIWAARTLAVSARKMYNSYGKGKELADERKVFLDIYVRMRELASEVDKESFNTADRVLGMLAA